MIAKPKTVPEAIALLEEFADLDGRLAAVEADRDTAIATANQRADVASQPMLERRGELADAIGRWWPKASQLADGKKSLELGGCILGVRKSRDKLAHSFESDEEAIGALRGSRFARFTTSVKYSLDRMATLKLLQVGGKTGAAVEKLGFRIEQGSDQFFLERVQQDRTVGS